MKIIDIVGDNYLGKWDKTRTACRGIVIENSKILLSYENITGQWMIPGGGLEENESEADCCIREIAEETGILVNASECLLEIDEYYENWKLINKYFICKAKGTTETKLTEREQKVGMEARWLSVDEAKNIFSKHASYAAMDEIRRGLYLREHTALCELV
ncbi:MAG: NUDIX hydrolase [Spirochaetales bacterium]|nr:NUDIX hydrolase [Spirochaetales bacterium]